MVIYLYLFKTFVNTINKSIVMSYYLVISFVIAVVAVLYVWYMSRGMNYIPDTTILSLHTTDNHLLANWFKRYIKPSFTFDSNEYENASNLLKRLYDIEVNPDILVIGQDLVTQYKSLSAKQLHRESMDITFDNIYEMRSAIGVNIDIGIIHNSNLRTTLRRNNTIDFTEINSIMEKELDVIARDYLKQVLKYRWEKILQLEDNNIINANISPHPTGVYDTFLYLRECNIPNIETTTTPIGIRINLLCDDL